MTGLNRDDIIRLAEEAGMGKKFVWPEDVERFANLVAAAEREACADLILTLTCSGNAKECFEVAACYVRARGNDAA